ncbi:MAG: AAA family ATPase [Microthrixaceae bacterium]
MTSFPDHPDELPARLVETHISTLVFVGELVVKRRKPVHTGFLDFTSVAARRADCEREVALNRRLAPDVYLGVADLSLPGHFSEPMVVMRRLPDERRLASLLDRDEAPQRVEEVARVLAAFHGRAERGPRIDEAATRDAMASLWRDGFDQLDELPGEPVPRAELDRCARLAEQYLAGREQLFTQRVVDGRAVDGHGDLLAEDIFCTEDGPQLLDCLEFGERYRYGDALADAAFLAMDLERLGSPELAERFLGAYAEASGDGWPPSLAHHYVAYRAHVRMKVAWIRVAQGDAGSAEAVRLHHGLCLDHLEAGRVRLVMVGGAPGTGKSTVARAVADSLDAVVVSSDEVRDELMPRMGPRGDELHAGRYAPERVGEVYDEVLSRVRGALAQGRSAVADASWLRSQRREAAREVALATHAELVELQCICPPELASRRIAIRSATGPVSSEATPSIATDLAAEADPWPQAHRVDTSGSPGESAVAAQAAVRAGSSR